MTLRATASLIVILVACGIAKGDDDYFATYSAQAPGDDPNTSGKLSLLVRDDDADRLEFSVELFNAADVTGIHLHLRGNSSDGLFGGPLVLALTNTTTANGQSPVSSTGGQPLQQTGTRTSQDLAANPQLPQVIARLSALGVNLGIDLAGSPSIDDLEELLDNGLIYTDVHTLQRVSPEGLTRGRVTDGEDGDDDDDNNASAGAAANTSATSSNDGDDDDEGDVSSRATTSSSSEGSDDAEDDGAGDSG